MLSPVIGDWSTALRPTTTNPSAAIRSSGRTTTVSPTVSSSTGTSTMSSSRRTRAVSGAEFRQRLDRALRPAHRVVLQRVADAEQEQQQPPLEELAEGRRPGRGDEHQEVDLELPPADLADRLLNGEISAEEIRRDVQAQRHAPVDRRERFEQPPHAHAESARDGEDEFDVEAEDHAVRVPLLVSLAGCVVVVSMVVVGDDWFLWGDHLCVAGVCVRVITGHWSRFFQASVSRTHGQATNAA